MLATSRARLESAIDARRAVAPPDSGLLASDAPGASWQAVSTSGFVRHGWARLSRSANETRDAPVAETFATLWPEGSTGWRLEGRGPSPAITADPVLPFFRSVLGGRQRGAD
jgi:hypothetical protein